MRIVFIGTIKFSEFALEKVVSKGVDVVAVITRKEAGYNSDYADLLPLCEKHNIECVYTDNINSAKIKECLRVISPDYIFCFGWSQLLDKELLDIPRFGAIGYHPALLPQNRGRHPIIWALALGLRKTGSTFFFIDEGVDSGFILSQREIKIDYEDDAGTLYKKITDTAMGQIEGFIPQLGSGISKKISQDGSKASVWRKRTESDGEIDWCMDSFSIYNLVRALAKPYAGAHFVFQGQKVKCWKAKEIFEGNNDNIAAGKILKLFPDGSFLVKAGKNQVRVIEYEPAGMNFKEGEYLR